MTFPDHIPLKINETAANVIDSHLEYIMNKYLEENNFSENALACNSFSKIYLQET